MLLHLISYILFIFSMLLYLFVYAAQLKKVVSSMTIIICISTLLSEVILVHIFIRICVGDSSPKEVASQNRVPANINNQSSTASDSSSDDEGQGDFPVIGRPNSSLLMVKYSSSRMSTGDD